MLFRSVSQSRYHRYMEDGTEPEEPNSAALMDALQNMLRQNITDDDTVLIDDSEYNNVIDGANDATSLEQAFKRALAAAGLDTTDDDKTTEEEIKNAIDTSETSQTIKDMAEFLEEEADDTGYGDSDLPPELSDQELDASGAYAWFQGKVSGIRSLLTSKIQTDFSGSCEFSLDMGTFGTFSASFCRYADILAMMGNALIGITTLTGLVVAFRG